MSGSILDFPFETSLGGAGGCSGGDFVPPPRPSVDFETSRDRPRRDATFGTKGVTPSVLSFGVLTISVLLLES